MIKTLNHKTLIILLLLPIVVSCIKNDLNEIEDNLVFQTEYSLPIGDTTFSLKNFVDSYSDGLIEVQNPNEVANQVFNYDGVNYQIPARLYLSKTFGFEFNKLPGQLDINKVSSLMFRFNTINSIPGRCQAMVYFTNNETTERQYLFDNTWLPINAADYNNGSIIPSEQLKNDIYFDLDQISTLNDKQDIRIKIFLTVENPPDQIIEFKSDQTLYFQFAVRLGLEIEPDEL